MSSDETGRVHVNDRMQKGYTYTRVAPEGSMFHDDFKPELTPKEMLEMGVFGGKYMTDCLEEFPFHWFEHARLASGKKDISLNFFQVDASMPLKAWQEKGWIFKEDPRGWFQWYCRYFTGRRIPEEDLRQIRRWKGIKRHVSAIRKNCMPMDAACRPRQKQTVLHWAYDPRVL
ncbi:MAG: hypothetical protein R6V54_10495 [Desulfobacteraceae bacterium]